METLDQSLDFLKTFQPGNITRDNYDYINSLDFSEDNSLLLSSSNDDTLHIYNLHQGSKERVLTDKCYGCTQARFTRDQNILSANRKGKIGIIRYISAYDQSQISACTAHKAPVNSMDISLNDSCISTSTDNVLHLWDYRQNSTIAFYEYTGSTGPAQCAFDPTSTMAFLAHPYSNSNNRSYIKLMDLRNFSKPYAVWDVYCPDVIGIEASDDGNTVLLSTNSNTLLVLEALSGKVLQTIRDYENFGGKCRGSLSADGKWLAVSSEAENSIQVFDVSTGELAAQLKAHPRTPHRLVWSKMYGLLVTACWNVISWVPS